MTILFRILRLFALVVWVGGLIFFSFAVTHVAFAVLPDAHTAGAVVRGTLMTLHRMGLIAGITYLVATLTLIATQRDSHFARALEVLIVLVMLAVTGYSHFSVLPGMDADLLALGGNASLAPLDTPARHHFDRLHGLSVKLEGAVLVGGVLLVCLAPLPRRDFADRMYT